MDSNLVQFLSQKIKHSHKLNLQCSAFAMQEFFSNLTRFQLFTMALCWEKGKRASASSVTWFYYSSVSNLATESNHFSRKSALVLILWNPSAKFENALGVWSNSWKTILWTGFEKFYEQVIIYRIRFGFQTVLTLYFCFLFFFFFRFDFGKTSKNFTPQTLLLFEWQNFQIISPK